MRQQGEPVRNVHIVNCRYHQSIGWWYFYTHFLLIVPWLPAIRLCLSREQMVHVVGEFWAEQRAGSGYPGPAFPGGEPGLLL